MKLPKTRRVGYVQLTLTELNKMFNDKMRFRREYYPVTVCAIHKEEGKIYRDEPCFILVISSENLPVIFDGAELPRCDNILQEDV